MGTATDVCNAALIKIGEKRITGGGFSTPTNERERVCSEHYDRIREAELRLNIWNFAVTRIELSVDAAAPVYGFDCRYAVPADAVRVLEVDETEDYQVEGGYILCNIDSGISIRYIKNVTIVNDFDPLFFDALAARIGVELCLRITALRSRKADAVQEYSDSIAKAAQVDAIENPRASFTEDTWITARL